MTKHTKGPWFTKRAVVYEQTQEDRLILNSDGRHIAEVFQYQNREEPDGPVEANAQLIVAAPELLAACLIALEDLETWRDESHSSIYLGRDRQTSCHCATCEISIPQLKAAIAKATGQNEEVTND